jgi:hypothetical protein
MKRKSTALLRNRLSAALRADYPDCPRPQAFGSRAAATAGAFPAFRRLLAHSRCAQLAAQPFRLQMDFVVEPSAPLDYYAVGMEHRGERHFEIGLDGLIFRGADGKTHVFPPGDGYVRSVMSMSQLRAWLAGIHGDDYCASANSGVSSRRSTFPCRLGSRMAGCACIAFIPWWAR